MSFCRCHSNPFNVIVTQLPVTFTSHVELFLNILHFTSISNYSSDSFCVTYFTSLKCRFGFGCLPCRFAGQVRGQVQIQFFFLPPRLGFQLRHCGNSASGQRSHRKLVKVSGVCFKITGRFLTSLTLQVRPDGFSQNLPSVNWGYSRSVFTRGRTINELFILMIIEINVGEPQQSRPVTCKWEETFEFGKKKFFLLVRDSMSGVSR